MSKDASIQRLIIRSWPKMIFLWPTVVIALCMGIAMSLTAETWERTWGTTFLIVFGVNLIVLTFEFPRATSLTVFLGVVVSGLVLLILNSQLEIITPLKNLTSGLDIRASAQFYYVQFGFYVTLFILMFVVTRFDYWELTPNELVRHHGILGDVERFSTAGLKLNKEISDVFEYCLAGSGTITMHVPGNPRPIVLENVLNISRIERIADRLLDARVVRIEGFQGGAPHAPPNTGAEQAPIQEAESG